jgi:hypothetical protein
MINPKSIAEAQRKNRVNAEKNKRFLGFSALTLRLCASAVGFNAFFPALK